MARLASYLVYCSTLFFPMITAAMDSTDLMVADNKKSLKQCCTTTIEKKNWYMIDCYNSTFWNCPFNAVGNAGSYTGQFPCKDGYVLMNVSTYQKWNVYFARFQQMIRAAWCAPIKYECKWISSQQLCKN